MNIKAVIFDLDGTVLDTLGDLHRAMNHALEANGYPTHDLKFIQNAIGDGVRELTRKSLPEKLRHDEDTVDSVCAQMREYYMEHWDVITRPYNGIFGLLRSLVENGISVNVLSNKMDSATQKMIPHWFGEIPFDCILGQREEFPRKPDPTSAKAIAAKLGIAPENILFVGDSAADMQTAKNAGMHSIGVLWGYRDRAVLLDAGAEFIAHTPQDIADLVLGNR